MTFEQAHKLFQGDGGKPVYVWFGGKKAEVSSLKKARSCAKDWVWYFSCFALDGVVTNITLPIADCQLEFKSLWDVCEQYLHEKDMDKLSILLAIHASDLEKIPFRGTYFEPR